MPQIMCFTKTFMDGIQSRVSPCFSYQGWFTKISEPDEIKEVQVCKNLKFPHFTLSQLT